MPIAGAKRKPPGQAVTRHVGIEFVEVENVPFQGAPRMPARFGTKPWPKGTAERWHAWSTMPHAKFWSDADWQFCFDALECAAKMVESGYLTQRSSELRSREKVMGTTYDYRRDLRIRYVEPRADSPTDVTRLDDFRAL